MFILTEHPFVFNYCFKKYKNLPGHLSWEAMQRLAASGSYIVVSDYRLGNRKVWVTENGGNTGILLEFVANTLQTVED